MFRPAVDDWEPPIPFGMGGLPRFPTDALPGVISDYVRALAASMQVPEELPGLMALAVISLCLAKKFRLHVKSDWFEGLNLYCLPVLGTGERKSPVVSAMLQPVKQFEMAVNEIRKHQAAESASALRVLQARLQKAETAVAGAANAASRDEAEILRQRLVAEIAAFVPITPLRLVADDVTPEALPRLLSEQGGRLALVSSEGGLFDTLAGRYSSGVPNLDCLLKAYSGDDITVDRAGREPLYIHDPALTVALTVQPDVVKGMRHKAGFAARGLLGRFLYAVPVSRVGSRSTDTAPVPSELAERYAAVVTCMLSREVARDANGKPRPVHLTFAPAAQIAFDAFDKAVEFELRPGGKLDGLEGWGAKFRGNVARIAGIIHVVGSNFPENPVSETAVRNAIRLGEYFAAHARAAFDVMGMDDAQDDARDLLKWILARCGEPFTKAAVHRAKQSRYKRAGDIDRPLEILIERNFIRRIDVAPPVTGRPPSPKYEINPQLIR